MPSCLTTAATLACALAVLSGGAMAQGTYIAVMNKAEADGWSRSTTNAANKLASTNAYVNTWVEGSADSMAAFSATADAAEFSGLDWLGEPALAAAAMTQVDAVSAIEDGAAYTVTHVETPTIAFGGHAAAAGSADAGALATFRKLPSVLPEWQPECFSKSGHC